MDHKRYIDDCENLVAGDQTQVFLRGGDEEYRIQKGDTVSFTRPRSNKRHFGTFVGAQRKTNGCWARISVDISTGNNKVETIIRARLSTLRPIGI